MKTVTESIYSNKRITIPMADVQHIERRFHSVDLVNGTKKGDLQGSLVITKHTKWNTVIDDWENPIWLGAKETISFTKAWCFYRQELEQDTLMTPEQMHQ